MPRRRPAPFISLRNNETYGDLDTWQRQQSEDNLSRRQRLMRNLRRARRDILTPRQQQMMRMYFDEERTMADIARELQVNKSTVSRNIARAIRRLSDYLRYSV